LSVIGLTLDIVPGRPIKFQEIFSISGSCRLHHGCVS